MRSLFRWLRGVVGTGAIWAIAWAPATLLLVMAQLGLSAGLPPLDTLLMILGGGARSGFIAGALFSVGLTLAYRNRSFAELRAGRIGLIGAIAGAVIPATGYFIAGASAPPLGIAAALVAFGAALGTGTSVAYVRAARAEALPSGEAVPELPNPEGA